MSKLKIPKQTEPTTQMFWIDSKTNLRHVFTCAKSKVATHAGLMKNNPYVKSFGEIITKEIKNA